MPPPHVYALAHQQLDDHAIRDANTGFLQRAFIRSRRKRKADEILDDDEDDQGTPNITVPDGRLSRETTAFVSLTAQEHAQRRLAGLPPDEPIPDAPFPHRVLPKESQENIFVRVRKELADVQPPLPHLDPEVYAPVQFKTNKERKTLREQHVAVLTTVLHLCLGRGDYVRAGRAWALLLRSGNLTRDVNVRQGVAGMDLRTQERWGIGAELLMRTHVGIHEMSRTGGNSGNGGYLDYSEEGFTLARKYYERLIIQYPSGSKRRIGAQATTFYSAMFSAWIYEISERYKDNPFPSDRHLQYDLGGDGTDDDEQSEKSPQLRDVQAIVSRMDGIIGSPPFDKHLELLVMRGMVELWIVDLSVGLDESQKANMMRRAAAWFRKAEKYGEELTETAKEVAAEWEELPEDDEIIVEDEGDEDEEMSDGED